MKKLEHNLIVLPQLGTVLCAAQNPGLMSSSALHTTSLYAAWLPRWARRLSERVGVLAANLSRFASSVITEELWCASGAVHIPSTSSSCAWHCHEAALWLWALCSGLASVNRRP